ncbi:hydroxymethylpyrimidine pyrophosphatase-like HAD family hydrolase [Paenibacillus shirakamiensis]|uniref:Hydroxymethylpyrimidine pyrophosphatase-like HAD family hydrolase n=1 Tax=Paenibacillus shirakamiensis TaxID=1265935 RepID=A0ABS4JGJ7_9BACL|nr:HAD family hydrolase [Paenibacillus shirakamiensis]MBP2000839.1 hydroxymethylpyrimidine pyrophosphatase-like HAD family hydrolase [Paenibacillus shirakamiensis]
MIFASDLDRTLIYSRNSMGEGIPEDELMPVELYNNEVLSFMTVQSLTLLKEISDIATFIPVTTRTIEQYQRIFGIKDTFSPKYAITSNGGNILIDGTPDQEWASLVQTAMLTSAEHQEIKELFDTLSTPDWALRGRLCDGMFYTIIIDRNIMPEEVLDSLRDQLSLLGWSISVQGRKMYLIPSRINKGDALRYIMDRLGTSYVAAAGDSLLDESLLAVADYAIAPGHGELFNVYAASNIYKFTTSAGIRASEELLLGIKQEMRLLASLVDG